VQDALHKARTDGLLATVQAIRAKLDQPMPVGYCNVGRVAESDAAGFSPGDRVVCNGRHADVVVMGKNLCARIPDAVSDDCAAFTVLGAIALQAVRLSAPTLGETFVVTGLGLVGLLAVQILRANGCQVLGIDIDPQRTALARGFGARTADLSAGEDPLAIARMMSDGRGVDGVLLTLSSTSNAPLSQAARMCRQRGRIVLAGVVGPELNRADFYEKELSFQVSCAYGPGRYDAEYEIRGQDYPFGLVRWTEQRNFEAVLQLLADGQLDVRPLISHRFDVQEAAQAYDLLGGREPSLGILIDYRAGDAALQTTLPLSSPCPRKAGATVVGMIGAGAYARGRLIGALAKSGATLHTLVSENGVSAAHLGRKYNFHRAASDPEAVLTEPQINAVCIATRHDSHAGYVRAALAARKHVFVEKPLALTLHELDQISGDLAAAGAAAPMLMVGFNRRFAPMVVKLKALLGACGEPRCFVLTVNAGAVAPNHWSQDPKMGGGRLVGEACHFIDLLRHLAGGPVVELHVSGLSRPGGPPRTDIASLTLRFADGSIGVINYFANGHRAYPKERLEVFSAGKVLVLDNYRRLTAHGVPGFSTMRALIPDKGQQACAAAFITALKSGGFAPIPLGEILEVSRLAIRAADRAG
jgi:predicted dehydrogenase/threonine dehydrogenase-like Zn-dependent dehydrogenase